MRARIITGMQFLKRSPLPHSPLLWLMLLAALWACLGAQTLGLKTASGQIYGLQVASWDATALQAPPRLGFDGLAEKYAPAPPVGANGGVVEASVTSGGTANAATVPGLKGQLAAENLANIAAQDARLAKAVSGDGGKLNFSVGSGTAAEANQLGKTWVGDGAQLVADQVGCPGCWKSADGLRIYRPPTPKNAPSSFNPTGVQANFVTLSVNPTTGSSTIVGNGHLVVLP